MMEAATMNWWNPELASEGFQAIIGQKSLDAFLLVKHFQSEFFLFFFSMHVVLLT